MVTGEEVCCGADSEASIRAKKMCKMVEMTVLLLLQRALIINLNYSSEISGEYLMLFMSNN